MTNLPSSDRCVCPVAGYCPRYRRNMTGRLYDICRGSAVSPIVEAQYKAKWLAKANGTEPPKFTIDLGSQKERARASKGKSEGLGDTVETALSSIGITSERVSKWLGRPCNCKQRKEKLNRLGAWAQRIISGKTENAERYLEEMLEQ